ncbi:bacteriohemerythrin [Undibacterium arcticum]
MEELVWSPEMSSGVPAMDDAHKALVAELAHLLTAPYREFGAGLFALIAEIERDFREEEALMEEIDFPMLRSHREQHASVLSALHHVVPDVMQGECASARKVIELLPQWFLRHMSTMDIALAVALDLAGFQANPSAITIPQTMS